MAKFSCWKWLFRFGTLYPKSSSVHLRWFWKARFLLDHPVHWTLLAFTKSAQKMLASIEQDIYLSSLFLIVAQKTYKSSPISWTNTNVQSRVIFKTFCPILSFGRLNITDICQILWLTKCAINTIPRKFDKVRLPYYRVHQL